MLQKILRIATHTRTTLSLLAGFVVLSWGFMSSAQAIPLNTISKVIFFGDSLTDSGFNDYFPTPAGKAPTFTTYTGYTWSQFIAHDIQGLALPASSQYPYSPMSPPYHPNDTITNNTTPINSALCGGPCPVSGLLTGVDYACGGSTTNSTGNGVLWAPSLNAQINHFLTTNPKLDPDTVYFVWAGANDLLKVFASSSTSPAFELLLLQAANNAAINIAQDVAKLSAHGAKRIVVMSLPNIGYTPLIRDLINDLLAPPSLAGSMKTASFTFNSMLNQQLGQVIKNYNVKILYIDVYDLLDNVILATQAGQPYVVDGEAFVFTNYTAPVCGYIVPPAPYVVPEYVPSIVCTQTPNGYIFADELHPTETAHRLVSLYVEQQLKAWA